MKRLSHKALAAIKNPKKVVKLAGKQFYVLFRFGPVQYAEYLKRAFGKHMFIHNFPNGIKTSLDEKKAKNWHLLNKKSLIIVVLNSPSKDISTWINRVYDDNSKKVHFLINDSTKDKVKFVESERYTILELLNTQLDFYEIKNYIHQLYRGYDVLIVDSAEEEIASFDIIRLQHAAYAYDDDKEIGFVSPAFTNGREKVAGYEFDRHSKEWSPLIETSTDYNQMTIPRYTLTTRAHGLYLTQYTIQKLSIRRSELGSGDIDTQISQYVMNGWKQNIRTLTFSPVVVAVKKLRTPILTESHRNWLVRKRDVENENGDKKVIYVLNATSVSGGIRVIFEHANGLAKRGFDVEIWSLQGQPTWTDLDIAVKKFRTYSDLLIALRNEDAIKVATWWETDQIVWLASVNSGIAVNFIQEFETWFYPEDPIARAAVVSSYRKEFMYMTTADYQQDELRSIGIESPIIPVGYEQKYYYHDTSVTRENDAVLALGRSFFQKNFAMTARAWKSLHENRPRLLLFGSEPDVLRDERVTYHLRPTNEEVNILYNQATCFVQTSRHEGFSLPIIEAMAAGCPVITTDSHGNRGFCHDDVNCLIVDQDNDVQLAEAMQKLLSDKALQDKLRKEGLKTAAQYEWSGILDRLAAFYKAL